LRGCWWLLLPLGLGLCVSGWGKTIHVPKDQPTIQMGIDAAASGDQVVVAAGTYLENIDFKGKAIQVISSDGPGTTIIDGGHKSATVSFHLGELRDSILSGFTITHGGSGYSAQGEGGGVAVTGAAPSIQSNVITANDCHGVTLFRSGALVEGNTISGSVDTDPDQCDVSGSGVYIDEPSAVTQYPGAEVLGNVIENNNQTDADLSDWYNHASGGGIYVNSGDGDILENNVIRNNFASSGSGGIVAWYTSHLIVFQNIIYGNSTYGFGGGMMINSPELDTPVEFMGVIANNTVQGNSTLASGMPSDIFFGGSQSVFAFVNNIVAGSTSQPAIACDFFGAPSIQIPVVMDHNDVLNASGQPIRSECGDLIGTYGNIASDPVFVSAATGDFHLKAGSPAIDGGNNSGLQLVSSLGGKPGLDDGDQPRVQDGTGNGYAVVDMGAFEYAGKENTAGTTLVVTPNVYEVFANTPITMTVQAISSLGIPEGDVVLFEDGVQLTRASLNEGVVPITLNPTAGVHGFVAKYAGQGEFEPGESVMIYVVVSGMSTSLACNSNLNPSVVGQLVSFGCVLGSSGNAASGAITFTDLTIGTTLGTVKLDSQGAASLTTSSLAVGTHDIHAAYGGDSVYESATADVQQVVNAAAPAATATALSSSLNPATVGKMVTFSAVVTSASGTVNGPVIFLDGTATLGTGQLNAGTATLATATLDVGTHSITAVYAGNASYTASTSTALQEVVKAAAPMATATGLLSSFNPAPAGRAVTFTATVASTNATPDGIVNYLDGTTLLGTAQLSGGTGNYTTASLGVGTHAITAMYAGSAQFAASTSSVLEQVIAQPAAGDFAVNITPGARTVFRGATASVAVAVTSEGGFSGTVALSCSGLPAESSCGFAPGTMTGSGGSTLTITTADWHPETRADGRSGVPWRGGAGGGLALGFVVMLLPRRWRRRGGYLVCLGLIAMGASSGCGSLKLVGGTPAGTYAIQIVGTSVVNGQTVRHSATEMLTVKKY
jgi:hypothetical protein